MKTGWSIIVLMASIALVTTQCKKEEDEKRGPNRKDLLLGTWRRNLRATDYNHNGRIDSADILNAPATDTLIFELSPDATSRRTQYYKGQPFPTTGTWHLQNNDQELVFQPATSTTRVDTFRIDTLSETYFRYHEILSGMPTYWEAFTRK